LSCLKFNLWFFSFSSRLIQITWLLYQISRFIDLISQWSIWVILLSWLNLWANSRHCCHWSWVSFGFFTRHICWFHFCIRSPHLFNHFHITIVHIRSSCQLIRCRMHSNNHLVNFIHHNSGTWSLWFGLVSHWIVNTWSWIILL